MASFIRAAGVVVVLIVLNACGSEADTASVVPGDGVLDCADGEVVRDAGIEVSAESEQAAVSAALAQWLGEGAAAIAFPESELWAASLEGRDLAVAVPELDGTGTWVVHDVQTCGAPDQGPAVIDGKLDCANDVEFSMQGSFLPDAVGLPTPQEELQEFLSQWRSKYGGEIVLVDEGTGSLIVDGREQVVATATPAPAGGWLVATTLLCEGFRL